jgi:hypothetical protein
LILTGAVRGQDADGLAVRAETGSGPYFVGQGFELRVRVVAAGQRPRVEPPRVSGADVWTIGTDLRPISSSGIGAVVAEANLFINRFRVVARHPGTLEIPAIRAGIGQRSGRSQPLRVTIRPVPPEGRPAEFLGGVGRFSLHAEVEPKVVRAGQELSFRITVKGPAAWGMIERPELKRYDRLGIGLRIEPKPDELTHEPPSRMFVYRLRPTRSGEAVLPPVAIAAFDPELSRYVTQVTAGTPVRVVAVARFDPATIEESESAGGAGRPSALVWTVWGFSAVLLAGVTAWLVRLRLRGRLGRLHGPVAARRYAARLARSLGSARSITGRDRDQPKKPAPTCGTAGPRPTRRDADAARRIDDALIRYLELGIGRPPGALTPDEVRQGIVVCTGSELLGAQAARLAARYEGILYRTAAPPAESEDDPDPLLNDARGLFGALGRVKTSRHRLS